MAEWARSGGFTEPARHFIASLISRPRGCNSSGLCAQPVSLRITPKPSPPVPCTVHGINPRQIVIQRMRVCMCVCVIVVLMLC